MRKLSTISVIVIFRGFFFLFFFSMILISGKGPNDSIQVNTTSASISATGLPDSTIETAKNIMLRATEYMVDEVSYNGGYLWYYLPDFSRRWGEMEAYETMIWLQHPGTISMGHIFLEAYHATDEEIYYKAAEKAARAVIWGQSDIGGWNYMVDFAGDRSLKEWYATIGKNGWRLEEFQHYYGNSTFDDNITSDATRFLLRMYLEKLDPAYKPALEKAIGFVLESQYELGAWPQRYPKKGEFNKDGKADYTSYYTFNDEVTLSNIELLIQCYLSLGQERFLDPIHRGMDFFLLAQQPNGAYGPQYNMDLEPSGARTYEPRSYSTEITSEIAMQLLTFYQYTGNEKFLEASEKAINWIEKVRLPKKQTEDGKFTHATFIDIDSGEPIYVHRRGSNDKYGTYYSDNNDINLLGHSRGKRIIDIEYLNSELKRVKSITSDNATKDSPLNPSMFHGSKTPQKTYDLNLFRQDRVPNVSEVEKIINALDDENRWLTTNVRISNPYIGDGVKKEQTDKYASTRVGDETDTSPYDNETSQLYISTREYIQNMRLLINFLNDE